MISIVFITAQRLDELKKAIMSCIGKSNEPYEIIVINNYAEDDIEGEIIKICQPYHISVKYQANPKNLGVAWARNIGYQMASGDIVYFLDDDAVVVTEGHCISEAADFLRTQSDIAVLATQIYNTSKKFYQHGTFVRRKEKADGEVLYFIGASHFINKLKIRDNYLYPNEFFYGGEEYFLSFNLLSKGLKVYYKDEFVVNHNPSMKTRMPDSKIMVNSYCNAFNVKRYFAPYLFLPVVWLVMIVRVGLKVIKSPHLLKVFITETRQTYNKKLINRLTLKMYCQLLNKYGLRDIL